MKSYSRNMKFNVDSFKVAKGTIAQLQDYKLIFFETGSYLCNTGNNITRCNTQNFFCSEKLFDWIYLSVSE